MFMSWLLGGEVRLLRLDVAGGLLAMSMSELAAMRTSRGCWVVVSVLQVEKWEWGFRACLP